MGDGAGRETKDQTKAGVIEVMEYRKATRPSERREGRQNHRNSERMPGMGPGMKASGSHAGCMQSMNGEAGHANRKIRRALSECDQRDVTRYVAIPLVLVYVAMAAWLLVWTAGRIA